MMINAFLKVIAILFFIAGLPFLWPSYITIAIMLNLSDNDGDPLAILGALFLGSAISVLWILYLDNVLLISQLWRTI